MNMKLRWKERMSYDYVRVVGGSLLGRRNSVYEGLMVGGSWFVLFFFDVRMKKERGYMVW